ncbi:hypothetical protein DAI22_10g076500 [Oryza sativa Japonica Group]|jgi:hypothetical protein|nr:hypothetical protein DAI22_10g076500 [Oryza sativa Japonica Group]
MCVLVLSGVVNILQKDRVHACYEEWASQVNLIKVLGLMFTFFQHSSLQELYVFQSNQKNCIYIFCEKDKNIYK